jgi:hypothetical protein
MAILFSGRHAAQSEKASVVSPSAMRGDKICTPGSWPRETAAMPAMMAELKPDLARGPLDARFFDDCYGTGVFQCWPGFDPVQVSVPARNAAHPRPGREFNRTSGSQGSVDIGHQTPPAGPGQCVSAPKPWSGLAAERRPATGRLDAGRSRIGRLKSAEDPPEQP